MATVWKTDKGTWAYRIKIKAPDGKTIDTTCRIDSEGKPFKTKREAEEARQRRIIEIKDRGIVSTPKAITLAKLYEQYQNDSVAKSKAYNTLKKQDSIWRNHIRDRFGNMLISDISNGHIENYLGDLLAQDYSYAYVEGHLKTWYLLFGYAYKYMYIDDSTYNRMLINKSSRLKMPYKKPKSEIEIYSDSELEQIHDVVRGTHHEIAFMIGQYCGLRIAETYALTWDDINMIDGSITINKQLVYQDGMWHFAKPKSENSNRKIEMPEKLQSFLIAKSIEQGQNKKKLGPAYRNHERIMDDFSGQIIVGADLINRKENGEIMTPNIAKYYRRVILERTGIEYRYHTLRHTHLSKLAWAGVPLALLMQRAGHSKPDTTAKYYIGSHYYDDSMVDALGKL